MLSLRNRRLIMVQRPAFAKPALPSLCPRTHMSVELARKPAGEQHLDQAGDQRRTSTQA